MCVCVRLRLHQKSALFFPSPAPVNICRRHLLHYEQICSSLHSLKQNHVCDIIMLQPFRPLFSFFFFKNCIYSPFGGFSESSVLCILDAQPDFELVGDTFAYWLHQPGLLNYQQLYSSRLTPSLLLGQTKLMRGAARLGKSGEDGHYFNSQRTVTESTSCSTLP